tara:strand:- start:392143 stop:392850 length:708 start_codon:yes stop_codon:yes gene_type:complete
MSGRDHILGKLKAKLGRATTSASGNDALDHMQAHRKNLIPARGDLPKDQRVALFKQEAEKVNATVSELSHFGDVPNAVAAYLRQHQLPAAIKIAPHPGLKNLRWAEDTSIEVLDGRANGDDPVSVSVALGGVAETGTLVMVSGPDTPTSLNFLPLDHIVVVSADDIAGNYEAVWERLRAQADAAGRPGTLPRTVNWITGPSRTADIEQTLLLGAHGPQRLHILIVDGLETTAADA